MRADGRDDSPIGDCVLSNRAFWDMSALSISTREVVPERVAERAIGMRAEIDRAVERRFGGSKADRATGETSLTSGRTSAAPAMERGG